MKIDARLAEQVRAGRTRATLRIYSWQKPCITLGRTQSIETLPWALRSLSLPIVHRPTGGGAVMHQPGEVTYALCAPTEWGGPLRDLPGRLHAQLKKALKPLLPDGLQRLQRCPQEKHKPVTLCFSQPVCGDLLYQGQKVAGCALRAWRDGFLLQGSLQGFPIEPTPLIEALIQAAQKSMRKERFELSRVAPLASETSAYASSATSA